MRSHTAAAFGLLAILAGLAAPANAQGDKPAAQKAAKAKEDAWPAFTPEREKAALAFARTNHAELADLLGQLKKANQPEYERAIRELSQTTETLAQTQARDPKKHELDLKAWTVNSRIQLLTARMSMAPTEAMQAELKSLVDEQLQVRLDLLKLDRERTATRLEKIDANIKALEDTRQQKADEKYTALLKGVEATRAKAKTKGAKDANKKNSDKPAPKPD